MKVLDYDGTDHLIEKIYDAINSGGSADYIVEEGTSGIWTYRKWASGIAECWGTASYSGSWTAWGSLYALSFNNINYPFTFYEVPIVQYTPNIKDTGSNSCWAGTYNGLSNVEKKSICRPALIRPTSGDTSTYYCHILAKGLWKAFTPSVSRMNPKKGTFTCTIPRLSNQNVTFNYTQVAENILVATAEITANTSSDGGRLYLYFEGSPSGLPFTPLKGFGGCECNNVCYSMTTSQNKNLWIGGLTGTMASGKYMTMRFILIG